MAAASENGAAEDGSPGAGLGAGLGLRGKEHAMPAKKKNSEATPVETDAMLRELEELSEQVLRFQFRWYPQGKVGRLCGFGEDVMSAFAALGAPIVARKCNPHLLHKWLEENIDKLGKIRA
jgi:hypothetical protein